MRDYIKERLGGWLDIYEGIFDRLVAAREPRAPEVSGRSLTEMLAPLIESGMLLGRAMDDRNYLVRQLQQFRSHLMLLFEK